MNQFRFGTLIGAIALVAVGLIGCGSGSGTGSASSGGGTGALNIDGSGTVFPIAAGLTEIYGETHGQARITVGKSGTGGGMNIFAKGETDIATASRPIKQSEIDNLASAGIDFIEVPIAYDGICIVVHPSNDFANEITVEQLHRVWDKAREGEATKWSDLNPAWPARTIRLYGPTSAHGTYEYFNEVVNGDGENVRPDYSQQAEYETLITGVSSEPDALGYVGFAYYDQNKGKLKAVPVRTEAGAVSPSSETIADGSYTPFSRPLMIYVKVSSYDGNPVCKNYVDLIFTPQGSEVMQLVGYVPLPGSIADLVKARLENKVLGSVLVDAPANTALVDLLSR